LFPLSFSKSRLLQPRVSKTSIAPILFRLGVARLALAGFGLLSPTVAERLTSATPQRNERGEDTPSDHVPVTATLEL